MRHDRTHPHQAKSTDETIALVVHDLREPVQAVRAFLAILLSNRTGPLNDVQRDLLETACRSALRMERLINDIKTINDSGSAIPLDIQPVNLIQRISDCCAELGPLASELGMEYDLDFNAAQDFSFRADPDRIDQILLNLIENATRYGTPGTAIRIRVRASASRLFCTVTNEFLRAYHSPVAAGGPAQPGEPLNRNGGLGVIVAKTLSDAHGGRLVTRISGGEITCGIVLPRGCRSAMTIME